MYRPPGAADREFWLYFAGFLASKLVGKGPDDPQDSFGPSFRPNRRFSTHLASNLMFLAGPDFGRDLTSPVAAIQLAAGAFFSVKMTIWDLTSPVAAIQLAAGAFFLGIQPPDYF